MSRAGFNGLKSNGHDIQTLDATLVSLTLTEHEHAYWCSMQQRLPLRINSRLLVHRWPPWQRSGQVWPHLRTTPNGEARQSDASAHADDVASRSDGLGVMLWRHMTAALSLALPSSRHVSVTPQCLFQHHSATLTISAAQRHHDVPAQHACRLPFVSSAVGSTGQRSAHWIAV